jgi:hypothetical protein
MRLFFTVRACFGALKEPQSCLKWSPYVTWITMTNLTPQVDVFASSSCVAGLNYWQNRLKPGCQNASVFHWFNLLWCAQDAANLSEMVPRGHMNDYDQPYITRAGLLIIIVRYGGNFLTKQVETRLSECICFSHVQPVLVR